MNQALLTLALLSSTASSAPLGATRVAQYRDFTNVNIQGEAARAIFESLSGAYESSIDAPLAFTVRRGKSVECLRNEEGRTTYSCTLTIHADGRVTRQVEVD